MTMITQAADFFSQGCGRCERFATADCSTKQWAAGLRDLRRICLAAGLLTKNGPNTRHADVIRFTDNAGPASIEKHLLAYLQEAKGYAEAGVKPAREAHRPHREVPRPHP